MRQAHNAQLSTKMLWTWRTRLLSIRLHQCSALCEAFVRVLLGLYEVAAKEVHQPLQVFISCVKGSLDAKEAFKTIIV